MFLYALILTSSIAHGGDYKVYKNWKSKYSSPDIIICKDAKTKKSVVKKAVDFWESEGFDIGSIITEKNNECKKEWKSGYILIAGKRDLNTGTKHGSTIPWLSKKTKNITSAIIKLEPKKANSLELVKHEMGHALGLDHSGNYGHIMYEYGNY